MVSRSLEIYNAYAGLDEPFELVIKTRSVDIDLSPLFSDAFEKHHAKVFGSQLCRDHRHTQKDDVVYKFTLAELLESFGMEYSPDELADFFERHLADDTAQSNFFANKVRNAAKNFNITYVTPLPLSVPQKVRYAAGPVNYSQKQFKDLLSGCLLGKRLMEPFNTVLDNAWTVDYGWMKGTELLPFKGYDLDPQYFRDKMPQGRRPNVIITNANAMSRSMPKTLHDIHIVSEYRLPTGHLEVVRRSVKKE